MDKQFIHSYCAVILKELGFDEPCIGVHILKNENGVESSELVLEYRESVWSVYKGYGDAVLAPTWTQAFAFLQEKFGLEVISTLDYILKNSKIGYYENLLYCLKFFLPLAYRRNKTVEL